jgi:hypothetical protein
MGNQWIFFYIHLIIVFVIGLFFCPRSLLRLYRVHVYQEPSDKQLMIYLRQVLFIVFFCCFFTFMIAFRLLTDFVFHGPNFGMSLAHMFALTGTGTFMFLLFGLSPENLRLWKLACGCDQPARQDGGGGGGEEEELPKEEPMGGTKIPDGSVSYVHVGREVETGMPRSIVIPETADYENFHIGTTVHTNNSGTPGTAGTALNFTPETSPHTPLQQDSEGGRPQEKETRRGGSRGAARVMQFVLPPAPQLVLNSKTGQSRRVVSSRHEEEPEEEDLETDYIELDR